MTGKKLHWFFCLILLNIGVQTVFGADIELTSIVNSTQISINDNIILTVIVSGSDANMADDPELEPMPEFSISYAETSTNIEIINFKTSVTKTFTYVLVPEKVGIFDVGAVSMNIGREKLTAPATKVKVISGLVPQEKNSSDNQLSQPAAESNIFINSFTDKNEVYVGEQITYTFEFYNRLTLTESEYEPPSTTGFWLVDLPKIPESIKTAENKQYYYNVIKTALFPTTTGELTIGPSSLTYVTVEGFFTRSQTQTLRSNPITINVKPLPEKGKPQNFDGAVGIFSISLTVDKTTVKVGDVIKINISVTGQGNLDLVTSLTEPDLSSFKTYDPKVTPQISNSGFIVGGAKTWEYVIIPKQQGNFQIEPFSISYFNSQDNNYYTASTQPVEIKVLPGDAISIYETDTGNMRKSITNIASDIRYLKQDKTILQNTTKHLYLSVYFYLLYVLPLTAFVILVAVKKRQEAIERNTGLKRKLNAWKNAQKRLDEASKMLNSGDVKGFCGRLHDGITCYVGDMLNIDIGTLTLTNLEKIVKKNGISPELAERFRKTLEMCDFVRFASVGTEHEVQENLLKDTRDIIFRLKDTL